MLDGSVGPSVNGCEPGTAGQGKLNHSFLRLGGHVNDIRKMTTSLVIEWKKEEGGKEGRE